MHDPSWIRFRELFTDWVADWPNTTNIKTKLIWRGYSAWWSTNLISKDNYDDNYWIIKLSERVTGAQFSPPPILPKKLSISRVIRPFIYDLATWLIVRVYFKKPVWDNDVCFLLFERNIIEKQELAYDRHLYKVFLCDVDYGKNSAVLLKLNPVLESFRHPLLWRKRVESISKKLQRNVVILDSFMTINDLFSVHWFALKKYLWISSKRHDKAFVSNIQINNVDCGDILLEELQRSFFGNLQRGLILGAMLDQSLSTLPKPVTVISYLETTALGRPVYFFVRKANRKNVSLTIQHTPVDKNQLVGYHRKREFAEMWDWDGVQCSPTPDYYFIQGSHAIPRLAEYYPKSLMRIIGCLKFDDYPSRLINIEQQVRDIRAGLDCQHDPIWLIAPTVGRDLQNILEMFIEAEEKPGIKVLISPHPHLSSDYIISVVREYSLDVNIEVTDRFKTDELLPAVDIVICGYSSIGLEAAIFHKPCIRVISDNVIPISEPIEGISDVRTRQQFWEVIEQFVDSKGKLEKHKELDEIVKNYFFKVDGKVASRFWIELENIAN